MKLRISLLSVGLASLTLVGCGANVNNASKPAADVMNATHNVAKNAVGSHAADSQHMRMASNISNQLVKQGYATHAFTFVVGDNAYVAVNQTKGAQTETNMGMAQKQKIEQAVRKIDGRIRNVYVSANPGTYARFQSFANNMQAGRPTDAVWNNFRTSLSRMFPTGH